MDPRALSYLQNPKSIKYYVKKYFEKRKQELTDQVIVDCPAGSGVMSKALTEMGLTVKPLDIFPEYFQYESLSCEKADLSQRLPLEDQSVDVFLCQEGIEHLPDQHHFFKEAFRVLKPSGKLIVTTPSYSNLKAKYSYLISESENFTRLLPPNTLDTIWKSSEDGRVYFGHSFLIGIQKLRFLSEVVGFKGFNFLPTKKSSTSMWLLPFFYPFILLFNHLTFKKRVKKLGCTDQNQNSKIQYFKTIRDLSCSIPVLTDSHLFVEIQKPQTVAQELVSGDQELAFHHYT